MLSYGLMPMIDKPTRKTLTSESLIDNTFCNIDTERCKSAILYSDISDHFPVLVDFCTGKKATMKQVKQSTRRVYSQSAIDQFINYLLTADWSNVYNFNINS